MRTVALETRGYRRSNRRRWDFIRASLLRNHHFFLTTSGRLPCNMPMACQLFPEDSMS